MFTSLFLYYFYYLFFFFYSDKLGNISAGFSFLLDILYYFFSPFYCFQWLVYNKPIHIDFLLFAWDSEPRESFFSDRFERYYSFITTNFFDIRDIDLDISDVEHLASMSNAFHKCVFLSDYMDFCNHLIIHPVLFSYSVLLLRFVFFLCVYGPLPFF